MQVLHAGIEHGRHGWISEMAEVQVCWEDTDWSRTAGYEQVQFLPPIAGRLAQFQLDVFLQN